MLFAEQVTRNHTLDQGLRLYEKNASDTKLLCTTRLSKKIPQLTRKNIFPHLFSQLNHIIDDVHSNDRYQNIKPKLTGYHFPHRQLHRGIIYQKTYSEHRSKHFLSRNDTNPLPFFYNGSQKAQTHCKLRLGMSHLFYYLLNKHLTTNSSCGCGEKRKDRPPQKDKKHTIKTRLNTTFYTAHVLHT